MSGVIREIAENMCGSKDKLQNAIDRGAAVVKTNDKGCEMIFFPTVNTGKSNSFSSTNKFSRGKAISDSAFKEMQTTIKGLGWNIQVDQKSLEAFNVNQHTHTQ
jgi:hypothetical protein